jgi:hypothetical protein
MGAVDEAKSEIGDEGMSTKKKVAAGAAIGVAVPAAVGVAKKLLGNEDDSPEESRQGQSARGRGSSSGSRSQARAGTSSTSGRSSATTRRSSSSTSGTRERTKEQLYNQAKRLNIDGRSKMTKAQLKRAVGRAKS